MTSLLRFQSPLAVALGLAIGLIQAPAQAEVLGSDAAACAAGAGPAALVSIEGFRDRAGQVRLELFSDRDDEFLVSGRKLTAAGKLFRRIDVPTPQKTGPVQMCMALPAAGRYTLVVLHDRNKDSKLNAFSDGVGIPGNPRLGLSKPKAEVAAFTADGGVTPIAITLQYVQGLSVRPLPKARWR